MKTSRNKDKGDKSSEEYKFYMNALYVGVTRAINSVYVIGNERKCNLLRIIKSERVSNTDIKKEESTPEEWRNMALELIDKGNIEQAKSIEEKLRQEGKEEYAEEIISALKAKGCYVESDKDKQASSELKTEPQKSSTMVPQSEKRKQSSNKKKKLTKKELEENTNMLFLAFKEGMFELVERLISQGVNVNARDQRGFTPLCYSVLSDYQDIAELLLQHRASVDAKSTGAETKGNTPLHFALGRSSHNMIKLLLQYGADVNARDHTGNSSLHYAASDGSHQDIVKLLLQHGAIIDARNRENNTPLHIAVNRDHEDTVSLLLQYRADADAKGGDKGYTPLYLAAGRGHKSIAKLFLEHGADVNAATSEGRTPLHAAVQEGHYAIVKLLLERGANVNAKAEGITPLHLAAPKGKRM
ncbi:Ankyrin repeat domain protein [Wolbachia endosymbiont of Cylisticus convexus]|nr:Ankyrin repeat domain protein [Wolbachia endosymbiont of Cylisticus convexus]